MTEDTGRREAGVAAGVDGGVRAPRNRAAFARPASGAPCSVADRLQAGRGEPRYGRDDRNDRGD